MVYSMLQRAWPLALAAVLALVPCLASAQTLIVRSAPPGESVELFVNTATAGTATADPNGDAIIEWSLADGEMDARIFVDICPGVHRVLLLDRNLLPRPQDAGCERRDVVGIFWLRRNSTLVVTVGRQIPSVLLRQAAVTIEQLDTPPTRRTVPAGLVVFGGIGGASFRDASRLACGNIPCDGDDSGLAYTAGAEFWLARVVSVEGSVIRTPRPFAEGDAGSFTFESRLEPRVVITVAGKVGIPVGPMRLYGKGGGLYNRTQLTTEQSMADETMAIAFETRGWGWLAAGGLEGWITPSFGLYFEAGTARLKGEDFGGGEARLNDRLNSLFFGTRIRILGGR
ncbi:hypothetical protein BH23ACI1_BH23ACI1_02880 [soil metagenome]